MMARSFMTATALCLFSLFSAASAVTAAEKSDPVFLYQWTDDRGVMHITDKLNNVPQRYRSRARAIEERPSAPVDERSPAAAEPVDREEERERAAEAEADRKAEWQERLWSAKVRLQRAEEQYRDLEQEKRTLLDRFGGGTSVVTLPSGQQVVSGAPAAPRETLERIAEIEAEQVQVRQRIDDERVQVEVVIPDEARKAGIPPGWLREVDEKGLVPDR